MSESDYIREIWTAYGIESSFGQNKIGGLPKDEGISGMVYEKAIPQITRGPFQIDRVKQKELGLSDKDVFDKDKMALEYINNTRVLTRDDEDWKKWDINKRAADLGISDETLRYMTWQQGRAGVIDIITTATYGTRHLYSKKEYTIKDGKKVKQSYTGTLGKSVKGHMNDNMGPYEKLPKIIDDRQRSKKYIQFWNQKWADKKEESKKHWGPQPDEEVMNEFKI